MIATPHELQPKRLENGESEYSRHYSEASFWQKLRRFARVAGREVAEKALILYYALQTPEMPTWARTVVLGALGYFILPTDAVPDLLPGIGFTDDLGALAAALAVVMFHVTPQVKAQAREKLSDWFTDPQPDQTAEES